MVRFVAKQRPFKSTKDWSELFADADVASHPRPFQPSRPPSSCRNPPPELSRPSTGVNLVLERAAPQTFRRRRSEEGNAPPPTPLPGQRDIDPAVEDLKQQWSWGFNQHVNLRTHGVKCLVCSRQVESSMLQGHLKICTAGGRNAKPGTGPRNAQTSADRAWEQQQNKSSLEEQQAKDLLATAATRHDPDYKNEALHKKKWEGVLEEEEGPGEYSGAKASAALLPQFDPLRGGFRLRMFAVGGGQEGETEELLLPSEGGSLGGGPCFGGRMRMAGSRLPRQNSDSSPGSCSSSPSEGWRTSASTSGVSGGFWEKHGARWRAEERRFGASAQALGRARDEREAREAREREVRAAREHELAELRTRELREAEEAARALAARKRAAAEYETLYNAFEYLAKSKKEQVTYGAVPWPAKGGSAEFVIDCNADASQLAAAEKRKLVLQWSRRWHPDTWAKYKLAPAEREAILSRVQEVSKKINALLD